MKRFFTLCPTLSQQAQEEIQRWWHVTCIAISLTLCILCATHIYFFIKSQTLQQKYTISCQTTAAHTATAESLKNKYTALEKQYVNYLKNYNKHKEFSTYLALISELLPATVKLSSFEFARKKNILLAGKAQSMDALVEFSEKLSTHPLMKKYTIHSVQAHPKKNGYNFSITIQLGKSKKSSLA